VASYLKQHKRLQGFSCELKNKKRQLSLKIDVICIKKHAKNMLKIYARSLNVVT
tara:strand:- start:111 stop:272 length:162 start_codon:yes stop_codon:yes gene_type:complete